MRTHSRRARESTVDHFSCRNQSLEANLEATTVKKPKQADFAKNVQRRRPKNGKAGGKGSSNHKKGIERDNKDIRAGSGNNNNVRLKSKSNGKKRGSKTTRRK